MEFSSHSFIARLTSMRLVNHSLDYLTNQYNTIKNANENLEVIIDGMEKRVLRITRIAFDISKEIVPYDSLDRWACTGLDKAESIVPYLTSVAEASTTSENSDSQGDSKKQTLVANLSHKAIDKIEDVIYYVLPSSNEKTCKESDGLMARISCIYHETIQRTLETGKSVAAKKGQNLGDDLSFIHITNTVQYVLSNSYQKLQIVPENEGTLQKPLRLLASTSIGVTLTVMAATEATLPRISVVFEEVRNKAKAASYATAKLTNYIIIKAYTNAKRTGLLIISIPKKVEKEIVKILQISLIHLTAVGTSVKIPLQDKESKQSNPEKETKQPNLLEKIPEEEPTTENGTAKDSAQDMASPELNSSNTENSKDSRTLIGVCEHKIVSEEDLEKSIDSVSSFDDFKTIGTPSSSEEGASNSPKDSPEQDSPPTYPLKQRPFFSRLFS